MDFAAFGQQLVLDVHNKITGKDRKFRGCQDVLGLRGFYPKIEHFRNGRLMGTYQVHNDITNEGKNTIFDVMFHDGTQIASSSWYLG
jgi:hypothetical protein